MPKRSALRYQCPERHTKVRIVSQPSAELQQLELRNETLSEEVYRQRREIAQLNLELDELMNSEPKAVLQMKMEMQQVYKRWEDAALQGQRHRTKVDQLQVELKNIKAEQVELRRRSENQINQLLEELKAKQAAKSESAANKSDATSHIVMSLAAVSISGNNAEDLEDNPASESRNPLSPDQSSELNWSTHQSPSPNNLTQPVLSQTDSESVQSLSGQSNTRDGQLRCSLLLPEDAINSDWFPGAFEYLTTPDLGEGYTALVEKWIALERVNGWASPRLGLAKAGRPAELTRWIRNSRKKESEPDLSGDRLANFAGKVWRWWLKLQPSWRAIATKDQLKPVEAFEDDWETLNKSGKSGWLCLLASLKWWGAALPYQSVDERKELQDDWLRAIRDMSMMLDGLLRYHNSRTG